MSKKILNFEYRSLTKYTIYVTDSIKMIVSRPVIWKY